jgi:hypothetical protein
VDILPTVVGGGVEADQIETSNIVGYSRLTVKALVERCTQDVCDVSHDSMIILLIRTI